MIGRRSYVSPRPAAAHLPEAPSQPISDRLIVCLALSSHQRSSVRTYYCVKPLLPGPGLPSLHLMLAPLFIKQHVAVTGASQRIERATSVRHPSAGAPTNRQGCGLLLAWDDAGSWAKALSHPLWRTTFHASLPSGPGAFLARCWGHPGDHTSCGLAVSSARVSSY